MATNRKNTYNSDPLDELLNKLNSGDFMDQSIYEFSEVVNDTVQNYHQTKTTKGKNVQRTTYAAVKPTIKPSVETATFASRYEQVMACLDNISFTGYSAEKKEGYQAAINRYRELAEKTPSNLLPLENSINSDITTSQRKIRTSTVDPYLSGYYDALLMVKKILFNSKLARLRVLSNKLK